MNFRMIPLDFINKIQCDTMTKSENSTAALLTRQIFPAGKVEKLSISNLVVPTI